MKLRRATLEDARLLHEWRNDPLTRENSFTTDEVPWENHLKWVAATLINPGRHLYVAVEDELVGTVRADISNDEVELHWTVAPQFRGMGLGSKMVACAVSLYPEKRLVASIKPGNIASEKIALSAGFKMLYSENGITYWEITRPTIPCK